MNRKVKRHLLAALACAQLSAVVLSPVSTIEASSYSLSSSASTRLEQTKQAVATMEGSTTKETLTQAMNQFASLFGNNDENGNMALEYNGHAQKEFDAIIKGLNKVDGSLRNELTIHFFNRMGLRFANDSMFFYDVYLTALTDNTTHSATHLKLMHSSSPLNQIVYDYDVVKADGNGNKVTVKDGNLVLTNPINYGSAGTESARPQGTVAIDLETDPAEMPGADVSFQSSWEDVYYEVVDGKYVRVTVTYKEVDGKVVSETKREVVPEHEALAGTAEDWAALNAVTSVGISDVTSDGEPMGEPQMARSGFTLHYSVNKDQDNAYYFDTGIRVSHDETASYQQVKDVLYQLALRANGYLAEDKGKFLIVVEGKPVLIREAKETYSKQEVEAFFEEFNQADMRIMPTRIGTTASLEEQLASGTQQTVQVNGEDAKLETQPTIEDHFIILPIEEIAGLLKLDVETEGDKVTVTDGDAVVVYEKDVKAVVIDGRVVDTAVPSKHTTSEVLMGDITPLNDTFGIEMIWDEEESMILLTTASE